jgi:hypothetical protein
MTTPPPDLLFIIGPPAVGKMAVGAEIAKRTGFKLLHNHMTIEPLLRLWKWEDPPFLRLVGEFRRRILTEFANDGDQAGLIFTVVWAFDLPEEAESIERYAAPFRAVDARVLWLELEATQEERMRRNETEFRIREKPSKQDLEFSRAHVLEMDEQHRFNSEGELDDYEHYLRIDNTELTPAEVAERAIDAFGLERVDQ